MAITTLAGYLLASKQQVTYRKSYSGVASPNLTSPFGNNGDPLAGTLAGVNTANGIVPVSGSTGYPTINAFGAGNTGYLTRADCAIDSPTKLVKVELFDRLFVAGAYSFAANTTLATQPSYSARLPGTDYKSLEIWIETVTTFTGTPTFTVTYTNEAGTTGRTTGATAATGALVAPGCFQLPLQTGDNGVQKIESVVETTASAGTFNVMVLRPLALLTARGFTAGAIITQPQDFALLGMPQLYSDTAIFGLASNNTSPDLADIYLEISNG